MRFPGFARNDWQECQCGGEQNEMQNDLLERFESARRPASDKFCKAWDGGRVLSNDLAGLRVGRGQLALTRNSTSPGPTRTTERQNQAYNDCQCSSGNEPDRAVGGIARKEFRNIR